MITRLYNNEEYTLVALRYQCINCNVIVDKLFSRCECGKISIQRGQRKDRNDARDVSIWKSKVGTTILQSVFDKSADYAGKPTSPAPIPKPAPVRADAPTEGA
jgi:hypothetical protein